MSKKIESYTKELGDKELTLNYYWVESDTKIMAGKLLTMIESAITDKEQKKALKDITKNHIREFLFKMQEMAWKGDKAHSITFIEE